MNRRHLLATTIAGLSAAAQSPLPPAALRETDPDLYWRRVRDEHFHLAPWRAYLNNGSLGVAPRPVVAAVTAHLEKAASLTSDDYPRWGYETLDAERARFAAFLGCKKEEIAFTHSATDSLSTIAAGLDLHPGDEVLTTDHEHTSGQSVWALKANRHGITVREVKLPSPPKSSAELAEALLSAVSPRTRVLFFSGILSPTGTIMPVRDICLAARAKGLLTVVDGAHMNGQIPLNLHDLACDFFAGSPHKWLFAPPGCGLLYIREAMLDRLWPTIVTGGWDDLKLGAARFMKIGTNNRSLIEGLLAGLQFLEDLGPQNVYARIHSLARRNYAMAARRPYIDLLSSPDHSLYGGLVTVSFKGIKNSDVYARARQQKIWIYGGDHLRLSTHIHTRPADLEALYSITDQLAGFKA